MRVRFATGEELRAETAAAKLRQDDAFTKVEDVVRRHAGAHERGAEVFGLVGQWQARGRADRLAGLIAGKDDKATRAPEVGPEIFPLIL